MSNKKNNVVGSQSTPMSLKSAISELVIKGKSDTIKVFLNFIQKCLTDVKGFYNWFNKKFSNTKDNYSIVVKVKDFFVIDLSQIRVLYSLMSSKAI
jgi:hypothetical protein